MIEFKACPKCRGDLALERDTYGAYRQCFQCGLILEQEEARMVSAQERAA